MLRKVLVRLISSFRWLSTFIRKMEAISKIVSSVSKYDKMFLRLEEVAEPRKLARPVFLKTIVQICGKNYLFRWGVLFSDTCS